MTSVGAPRSGTGLRAASASHAAILGCAIGYERNRKFRINEILRAVAFVVLSRDEALSRRREGCRVRRRVWCAVRAYALGIERAPFGCSLGYAASCGAAARAVPWRGLKVYSFSQFRGAIAKGYATLPCSLSFHASTTTSQECKRMPTHSQVGHRAAGIEVRSRSNQSCCPDFDV